MIIRGRKDAQVVGSGDCCAVFGDGIADCCRVFCNSSALHIIACLGANQETFMPKYSINVGTRAFDNVEESSRMEVRLLEVEIEFRAEFLCARKKFGQDLGFQAFGNLIIQLKLGFQNVGGRPLLGER